MSPPELVAVTGATGAVGGRVARRLAAAGVRQRLVVRDPSRAPSLPGTEVVRATYDEPEAMRAAFAGADAVFLVSAAEHPDRVRQHLAAVDAVADSAVPRVVYTSFLAAGPDAAFTLARHHWATEERMRARGLAYTALRDSLYLDWMPLLVGADDVIRGPADGGRVAPVARDDIADVAVAVLLQDGHEQATYDVTGGRLQTFAEIAAELSALLGREIAFQDETLDEAWQSRAVYGAPDWEVEGWITSYLAVAKGELAVVSDTVERIAGHPPTTLRELVERDPSTVEHLRHVS
ncbi:MAG: SDR family oxidoreductase [Actinomycetes bacterium]